MKRTELKRKTPLRRSPKLRPCAGDGCDEMVTKWSTTGLCRRCIGRKAAARNAGLSAARSANLTKSCAVCGREFGTYANEIARRKTCSRRCAAELKRRKGGSSRRGRANPNYRAGRRVGERDRRGERRWYTALGRCCEKCGSARGLHLHHVIYRQEVRRLKGDEWDTRNAMTLCVSCHASHHQRGRLVDLCLLSDRNIEFAFELMGTAAYVYLCRYYGSHDERVELALAELEHAD